jgi:hypothetical protein
MSIEDFSLDRGIKENGLTDSDVVKFKTFIDNIRHGVKRGDLTEIWEFLRTKTDGQLEALSAAYIKSLPESEKQHISLPIMYETLKRLTHALEDSWAQSQQSKAALSKVVKLNRARPQNLQTAQEQGLNRQIAGRASDAQELQLAVDDPETFWRMFESLK